MIMALITLITTMSPAMYFTIGAVLAVLAVAGMWVRFTVRPGRDEYHGPDGAMFWFVTVLTLWPFVGFTLAAGAAVLAILLSIDGIIGLIGFLVRLAFDAICRALAGTHDPCDNDNR